jgi:hypothetical protein
MREARRPSNVDSHSSSSHIDKTIDGQFPQNSEEDQSAWALVFERIDILENVSGTWHPEAIALPHQTGSGKENQ